MRGLLRFARNDKRNPVIASEAKQSTQHSGYILRHFDFPDTL